MKNKYIRFLIILNGSVLPFLLFFAVYNITKEFFFPKEKYQEVDHGIIVGEEIEEAKKNEYALQGLNYSSFDDIYNSTNFYLTISSMTYEEKKNYKKYASYANDYYSGNQINVIFLNKDYQVINTLLDRKACILGMKFQRKSNSTKEIDTSVKYIAYSIAFEDTNKDNKINHYDNGDLYISDLEGRNLKKVTENIYVEHYKFIDHNSRILIHYKEIKDIPEEHKEVQFAIYDIANEKFTKLNSLNSELKRLEDLITGR